MAAAIEAWKAVSANAELRRGKSVKQALNVWLRQQANEFGLTKEDGNPNEQGIEDVAKIANWDTRGGAPKTPGRFGGRHPVSWLRRADRSSIFSFRLADLAGC